MHRSRRRCCREPDIANLAGRRGLHIRDERAAATVGARLGVEKIDDEKGVARFRLSHPGLRNDRPVIDEWRVPAPMHAIAEPVPNARPEPILWPPEAHDILVELLRGRQLDEID